jgi:hypothetical protein
VAVFQNIVRNGGRPSYGGPGPHDPDPRSRTARESRVGGQRVTARRRHFSNRPPREPRVTDFRVTWLSRNLFREDGAIVASVVDVVMAILTDNQRFAATCDHFLDPLVFVPLAFLLQVSQFADVVNFDVVFRTT